MQIDIYGNTSLDEKEIFDFLYQGKLNNLSTIYTDIQSADKFNRAKNKNKDHFENLKEYKDTDVDIKDFDNINQKNWFMPKDYCPLLIETLYSKCKTDEEINRVSQELELYVKHNMMDLLYYLKYLVDTMRKNNVLWGVGRGSSVASYVLFLIGVHKINSLKYNLDINEFLK
jgi:DNA polymerase III alpha subunit